MKKQFLIALAICVSTISFAQVSSTTPTFGVRAGIISSGIRGDASNNLDNLLSFANGAITTSNHTGFFAGGYANVPVTDMVSLEPGLFYSEKGYDLIGSLNIKGVGFLGANAKAKLQSTYIDIPLLLKVNISGLQLFAGPQFSYLMKANLNTTASILGFNLVNSNMDATQQFNRWDAAITGGLGYKLTNGINISASYDYGLSKLDANKNANAYNNAIKLGVGIEF
ncbi:MAG TPA: porin family protein [Chitinophagaceae bacterium]